MREKERGGEREKERCGISIVYSDSGTYKEHKD